MTADRARALFSDYLDHALDPGERDELQGFLAATPDLAAELIAFERTVNLLHRLPAREPVLDLWSEFAPAMAEYEATRKQGVAQRIRSRWLRVVSEVSSGVILYTRALAENAHRRLAHHLMHDSLIRHER